MNLPDSINFELSKPIPYSYEGQELQGTFITLYQPTRKNMDECIFLKQAFFDAAMSVNDEDGDSTQDKPKEDEQIKGEDIIALFYRQKIDMKKVVANGISILRSGAAKIEGVKDLTAPMIDHLSCRDLENIIGAYVGNFIVSSLMKPNT